MNTSYNYNSRNSINFGTISSRFQKKLPRMHNIMKKSISRCSGLIDESDVVMLDIKKEKMHILLLLL